jgi:RNA polymerase sigma-70 factor (ECF subfamily)
MPAIAELSPPDQAVAAVDDEARPAQPATVSAISTVSTVIAARQGDRASMQAIYEAEAPRLLRRLRHLTGNLTLAQDLTHDVFVVAFSGRASFDGNAPVSSWLYGIARNTWLNDRRKLQRRAALLAARPPEASSADASEVVVVDELQRRLDVALSELPERLREAFVLRVIEGLPVREAAQLAGVSLSTLSKRARAAEARIRAAIEGADEGEAQS